MNYYKEIHTLYEKALKEINTLSKNSLNNNELQRIKIIYLGKKSLIQSFLKELPKQKNQSDKIKLGKAINEFKINLEKQIEIKEKQIQSNKYAQLLKKEAFDVTLENAYQFTKGSLHPISQTIEKIYDIFYHLGFEIAEGFEIENQYYNFEALNIPEHHPSRKDQDSFYINSDELLRTQTTPIQIRILEKDAPPLAIISIGRCFRKDNMDNTHSHTFHQLEAICIDKDLSLANLKGTMDLFIEKFFSKKIISRFQPDFFPFTRPSAEYAIKCFLCSKDKKICSLCKNTKWIEIGGSGLIHPEILKRAGIDHNQYSGYAFGVGIERLAMLAFKISDIRLFYENDLQFLKQF